MTQSKSHLRLRALCEGAIFIALAQVLSYLKLYELPQGGSITIEMLPIFLYCARWGFGPGMLASFAQGRLLHRHGRRQRGALSCALCRRRDDLGRVYARDLLRHDDDVAVVLLGAV